MKQKTLVLLLLALVFGQAFAQQDRKIENAAAFTQLFGYVRYFHPSDEAAAIDWDRFAIYGSKQVEGCKSPEELRATLAALFQPIAPTMKVYLENETVKFDAKDITPSNPKRHKSIAWQHQGVGMGNANSPYQSIRLNRPVVNKVSGAGFGFVGKTLEVAKYQDREFVLKGRVKLNTGPGTAHLWARVHDSSNQQVFFENMSDRPIRSNEWATYELKGKFNANATKMHLGAIMSGEGELWLDDISLTVQENGSWVEVYVEHFSSEKKGPTSSVLGSKESNQAVTQNHNYLFTIIEDSKDGKWMSIKSKQATVAKQQKATRQLFKDYPAPGEYTAKTLAGGVKAIVPLALYGTDAQTYPAADKAQLAKLQAELAAIPASDINGSNRYTRLGGIAIAWNIFQHFYPYFDFAQTDWNQDLHQALSKAYTDQTATDFRKTLRLLTAKLKDGHVSVNSNESKVTHQPPIAWEWVEDKLVIMDVYDDAIPLNRGDIVTSIEGAAPEAHFEDLHQYISAATKGWLHYIAQHESLLGEPESTLHLTVLKADNSVKDLQLKRTISRGQAFAAMPSSEGIKSVADGIMYLNIGRASMKDIQAVMPQLQQSKAIICDLRGYPNSNHELIQYLLPVKDTSSQWMQIPYIIYPDQENITGYRKSGWSMRPKSPRLTAKVIFLIDGRAISYAESYMSFIEHYKLATIVGQPTAGTNGNVNPFTVPGGYRISWTGMKVQKHDGSPLHGVGIIPDVYVEKTIKGVREGRDEFLEKALEIATKSL